MDLNALRVFVEVVNEGGFTAAARSLGMSKTSVSKKVQQLEEQLSTTLLTRTTRSVTLTEQGEEIFGIAVQITAGTESIERLAESTCDEPQGLLRIAAPPLVVRTFLGVWVTEFRLLHSKVRIDLISSNDTLDFRENQLDFAIRLDDTPDLDLVSKQLFEYRLGAYASPDLVETLPPLVHPLELKKWPCIGITTEGQMHPWVFQQNRREFEFLPEAVLQFDETVVARDAAVAGAGALHVGCKLVETEVEAGKLVPLVPECWPAIRRGDLVYIGEDHMALKNRLFIEFIEQRAAVIAPFMK